MLNVSGKTHPSQISTHRSTELLLTLHILSPFYVFFFVWRCQEGAMKPYTSAIMTPERLGDEFTSVMWNSAHVWRGKSAVKESATQVRRHLFFFGPDCVCRQAFVLHFNSQLNRGGGNYFVLNSPCMWRQHLNQKQKLTRGRSWQFHICAEHERWIRATLWY